MKVSEQRVYHLGLVGEVRVGVDESSQLDDLDQPVEVAAAGHLQVRDQVQRAGTGGGGARFGVEVVAELAEDEPVGIAADLARDVDRGTRDDEVR